MNEEVTITLLMYVDEVYKESPINHAFEFAHLNLGIAAQTYKYYDKGLQPRELNSCDGIHPQFQINKVKVEQTLTSSLRIFQMSPMKTIYILKVNQQSCMWVIVKLPMGDNLLEPTASLRRKP